MTSQLSIRYATRDDLGTLQNIFAASYNMRIKTGDISPLYTMTNAHARIATDHIQDRMSDPDFHVLLAHDEISVGYLSFYKINNPRHHADIIDFHTHPSPHHYGRQIMQHFFETAPAFGITRIGVNPNLFAHNNEIYQKFGFIKPLEPIRGDTYKLYKYLND